VIALDTSVLVRLFVAAADEAEHAQQSRAAALLQSDRQFFVPVTVTLEFVWVLRFRYGHAQSAIAGALE
jgi:predicted nucleic-acid-binding protein